MKRFDHNSGNYFEIDGANIYYEQIRNTGKPFLLLLHGGFGDIEEFNSIVPLFCEDFHIISIDSRGQGKSTLGTEKLTYERLQLDVEAVLDHLKIRKLSIIGFSDGGIIALRIAKKGDLLIEKLIVIGSAWSLNDVESTSKICATITTENAKEIFADSYENYKKNNPNPDFEKLTKCILGMWVDKTASGHPFQGIEAIESPTLIIRGNDDFLFSFESGVELSRKLKNSIFFNIPFASHEVFKEQPDVFGIITKQFFLK